MPVSGPLRVRVSLSLSRCQCCHCASEPLCLSFRPASWLGSPSPRLPASATCGQCTTNPFCPGAVGQCPGAHTRVTVSPCSVAMREASRGSLCPLSEGAASASAAARSGAAQRSGRPQPSPGSSFSDLPGQQRVLSQLCSRVPEAPPGGSLHGGALGAQL